MRHTLLSSDPEYATAWTRLASRYGVRARWGQALESNQGAAWLYSDSERIDGDWWHVFTHSNHPKFGRIREMLPASPDWEPVPATQPMWVPIW